MKARTRLPETMPERLRVMTWVKTLWPYLMEYRWRVLIALLCLLAAKLASVAMPFLLKYQVDHLAGLNATDMDWWLWFPLGLLLAYGAVRFLNVFVGEVRDVLFGRVTERAMRRMALRVFQHLHRLSLNFHLDRQTGALQRDIERGTNGISFLMRFMIFNIGPTFIELALVIGILLVNYPPVFALITSLAVVSYVAFSVRVTEWRTEYVRQANQMDSSTHARALDSLLNYETVKYFTAEQRESLAYDEALAKWEQARRKNRLTLFLLNSGQALIISVAMAAMLMFAAYYVIRGEMTVGDFTLVNAFMFQLFLPLNLLGFVYREIKASMANIERLFELLDEVPGVADDGASTLQVTQGRVEFENVHFTYPNGRKVLNGLNLVVEPGQTLALVGTSGAGKSTLTRLLWRFYDSQQGDIRIDGQSLRAVSQQSLRSELGIVPQDTVLFNDTLKNNLLYARPDATDEALQQVADMSQLSGLLEHAEQGWETLVGERGLKLSGGEKQRLAIARMLLKQPAIQLFDEATSSLDSATESSIMRAIQRVAKGKTAIIIAHRLSTIVDADQIAVMDAGCVVEQGTHTQLLQRKGAYWRLWQAQLRTEEGGSHAVTDH
ncbi:metal ABC transporter permease [Bacterioplanes sanyensis]|uniref:Metal ABC transporter permease n=1 Tax=Bacterioplanes sanyensis TaxID=1249553 RepID=A0A222FLM7_9GAMM|nr:ABC transporter ATP-binding protein/permease [Bacterioplanes sanyensis]ASP39680.1 metal ABC transporter permease [Bacterioplanes sanyensis]